MQSDEADIQQAITDLRDHESTLITLVNAWQSLASMDRDTDEAEDQIYRLLTSEIRDLGSLFEDLEKE